MFLSDLPWSLDLRRWSGKILQLRVLFRAWTLSKWTPVAHQRANGGWSMTSAGHQAKLKWAYFQVATLGPAAIFRPCLAFF